MQLFSIKHLLVTMSVKNTKTLVITKILNNDNYNHVDGLVFSETCHGHTIEKKSEHKYTFCVPQKITAYVYGTG